MTPPDFTTQSVLETHRRLLKCLAAGPGLLLVEGPSGSGKSHLKRQLGESLALRFTLVDLPYSRLDPRQFATMLYTQLSPGAPPVADPVARIEPQLAASALAGRPLLLLIDDAQFMPHETRGLLATLAPTDSSATPPVYGILFTDSDPGRSFTLLPGADPEQGLRQRLHLSPPAQADMERFLERWLSEKSAGHLPDSAREAIIEEARGNLRRLRQLTELALMEAAEGEEPGQTSGHDSEPSAPRREGGGQFAFGLVSGNDIQGPGPDLQRVLKQGDELDALTAKTERIPKESDPLPTSTPCTAVAKAQIRNTSRRRFPLTLIVAGSVALAALLLNPTALEKNAWLQRLLAQEKPTPTAVEQATLPVSSAQPPAQGEATNLSQAADTGSFPTARGATAEDTVDTTPTPEPASTSLETTRWLDQAQEQEAAYQLTLPAEANAILSYRQALELDPENPQARAGVKRIKALYRRRAEAAAEQQAWEKARHNLSRLLWIEADDPVAISMLARLATGSEQGQATSNQQADEQQPQQ